jgi:hypothetical protein
MLFLSTGIAGPHKGEIKQLSYSIEYDNYRYLTDDYLEDYGYSDVPAYYIGDTMHFNVTITNTGKRTFKNLKVEAIQYHYPDVLLPNERKTEWLIERLGPGETISLKGAYKIDYDNTFAGLDNTRLIIKHLYDEDSNGKDKGEGRIIIDDQFAGIWCPLEIYPCACDPIKPSEL